MRRDDMLVISWSSQCSTCRHAWSGERGAGGCDAFPRPQGIPDEIFEIDYDHRQPFPGDQGIVYEPEPDCRSPFESAERREWEILTKARARLARDWELIDSDRPIEEPEEPDMSLALDPWQANVLLHYMHDALAELFREQEGEMTPELFERVAAEGERRYLRARLEKGHGRLGDPLGPLGGTLRAAHRSRWLTEAEAGVDRSGESGEQ